MYQFAEIVFPTPVRTTFTYSIPNEFRFEISIGKRVWIPFRNKMTIGVVVGLHNEVPDFKTLPVQKIMDSEVLITEKELEIYQWMSRFYYCSLGEVIQAALPSGLNFISKEEIRIGSNSDANLSQKEEGLLGNLKQLLPASKKELDAQFNDYINEELMKSLLKKGAIEVWEIPDEKLKEKVVKAWNWATSKQDFEDSINIICKENKKLYRWVEAGLKLTKLELPLSQRFLESEFKIKAAELSRMQDAGLIKAEQLPESMFLDVVDADVVPPKQLNNDQKVAYEQIERSIGNNEFKTFLLNGITGSGKTEVYIHALEEVLALGKNGIILVPEIALTPQFLSRFQEVFGDQLAVYHSRLNERERKEAWLALKNNEKKAIIGTRSAIFTPVENLGLIILDEEHDQSYKQEDPAPRYHAREVAVMRAIQSKAVVILGSATPSMQALHMINEGKMTQLKLTKRHSTAELPEVRIIDLKQYRSAMRGPLSVALFQAVEEALSKKEQVILLQNRRGYSSYLQCMNCGNIPQSPNASVSLTYHKYKNILLCHYSGYSRKADTQCEVCGSSDMQAKGMGTQQVEEEIQQLFPEARILRMDRDTTSRKNSHAEIIQSFERGEADILLGTQLVTKGLDFPNVTVVGVIDADTELAFPSFQSIERSYQVLSQVAGRAGRSEKKGRVLIQTHQSEEAPFPDVVGHNFESFSKKELQFRSVLNYPPYSRLIGVTFKGKNEALVSKSAHLFTSLLRKVLNEEQVLGPSPSSIQQIKGTFYWECSIKLPLDKGDKYIEHLFDTVFEHYNGINPPKSVRINVNVGKIS